MGVSENRDIPVHPKICRCCTWENDDQRSDIFRHHFQRALSGSPMGIDIHTAGK